MRSRVLDNVAATTPIGMNAVARHWLDYDLPSPLAIDGPRPCDGRGSVRICLASTDVDAWLDTINVDDETTRTSTEFPNIVQTAYDGRLPNGVRVQVLTSRKLEALRVVTA